MGFIVEKVNEATSDRLMYHLKQHCSDWIAINDGDDDTINGSQCIFLLIFAAVLFLKFKEKREKREVIQVNKDKLKKALMASYEWILENKLKDNQKLPKSQFEILGKWLQEFYK